MADFGPRRLLRRHRHASAAIRSSAHTMTVPWLAPVVVEMTYLPLIVAADWVANRVHLEPDPRAPLVTLIGVFTILWLSDFASGEESRLNHRTSAIVIGGLTSLALPLLLLQMMTVTVASEFWAPRVIAVVGATIGVYVFVGITHLPIRVTEADLRQLRFAEPPVVRALAVHRERFLAPAERLIVYSTYQRIRLFLTFLPFALIGVGLLLTGLGGFWWRETVAGALVLVFCGYGAARSLRVAVVADPYAVTVRNVLATTVVPWSQVRRIAKPSEDRHRQLRIDRLDAESVRCMGLAAIWFQNAHALDERAEAVIALIACDHRSERHDPPRVPSPRTDPERWDGDGGGLTWTPGGTTYR